MKDAPTRKKGKGKSRAKTVESKPKPKSKPTSSVRNAVRQERVRRAAAADPDFDDWIQRYGSQRAMSEYGRLWPSDSDKMVLYGEDSMDDSRQDMVELEKAGDRGSMKRKVDRKGSGGSDSSESAR